MVVLLIRVLLVFVVLVLVILAEVLTLALCAPIRGYLLSV